MIYKKVEIKVEGYQETGIYIIISLTFPIL